MGNLALITARGGSKRIPKKNIKPFLGKPIISYSIEAALKSELFDEVMVSTDSKDIAGIAKQLGAQVPFFRSETSSNDFATLSDVVLEVLEDYKKNGKSFENVCCILPTAPFVSANKLKEGFSKLEQGYDSVFPVVEFSYPIQRSLKVIEEKAAMVWEEHLDTRSQDLPKRFHDVGQWYWLRTHAFLDSEKLFMRNSSAVIISELQAQDIDTETDWKLAELKYQLLYGSA